MVLLSEALYFRMVGLLEEPGIRLVRLIEAPRFSYGWMLGGLQVFVSLDS